MTRTVQSSRSDARPKAGRWRCPPRALLRGTRPRHWIKNLLVLATPIAAGKIFFPSVLLPALVAAVALSLISSGVYLFNDIMDRKADRAHPKKRFRPIASGELPVRPALLAAVLLLVAGNLLAAFISPATLAVTGGYSLLMLFYSAALKHEPVIDIAVVALGFVLRAVAGGVAAHIFISHWFLLVAGFGSLFVVAGKRYSELITHREGAVASRRSLASYTPGFLNFVRSVAAGATVITYCQWAFERAAMHSGLPILIEISIAPFVLAILRYALLIENGVAEAPEELLIHDTTLLALGLSWSAIMAVGLFVF